jgi:hypothetical protein
MRLNLRRPPTRIAGAVDQLNSAFNYLIIKDYLVAPHFLSVPPGASTVNRHLFHAQTGKYLELFWFQPAKKMPFGDTAWCICGHSMRPVLSAMGGLA